MLVRSRGFAGLRAAALGGIRSSAVAASAIPREIERPRGIGAANLEWDKLGFQYQRTNGVSFSDFLDGEWKELGFTNKTTMKVNMASTSLQYGQSCFEGLKAFATMDGRVKLFRPDANAERMNQSAHRLLMPLLESQFFIEACKLVSRKNIEFVPPYGTGGALYLRPTLVGLSPRIGVQPSDEYRFTVIPSPVANYYQGGTKPVTAVIVDGFDRAAPRGLGNVKTAANYAADLLPSIANKKKGFEVSLYLDSKYHKYIEEFGTSNFAAIKGDKYITPDSSSILDSITNRSIQKLAEINGFKVERRPVELSELSEMDEVASLGTAAAVTPVTRIMHGSRTYEIGENPEVPGPVFQKLYWDLRRIQQGEVDDELSWMYDIMEETV